jgi:glyoxylase-like metal-dependent hydrolase (beta-lactamase superfamily II)
MLIESIVTGPFQENVYLVATGRGEDCVIIDPGDDAERIQARIAELELNPVLILNTHGHLDHIGAVPDLQEHYEIPFAIHPADRFLLSNVEQHARLFGLSGYRDPVVDRDISEGEVVEEAGLRFEVLGTPGHTPGGVTFVADGHAFVGDCLFMGSIGRTDLPGGDPAVLKSTLHDVLLKLPDETVVHSGHGPDTSIGRERASNPFLTGGFAW